MAYLKQIGKPRCSCGKPATKELFNQYNAALGVFCGSCGESRLVRQQSHEKALAPREDMMHRGAPD